SNHTTFGELASELPGYISRYANEIEVIRCDASGGTCGKVEKISIKDLPAVPGNQQDGVFCDNRPLRHVPGAPANHDTTQETTYGGILLESDETERIYGLEWESLYTTTGQDGIGSNLNSAVEQWKKDANGVVLDHRTGYGGTIVGPEILWNF